MYGLRVVTTLCLTLFLILWADEQPRTLQMASSIAWTVPPFQSSGHVQCDGDGNLYFNVSGAPSSRTVVMKVARDGSKYELYTLPPPRAAADESVAFVA